MQDRYCWCKKDACPQCQYFAKQEAAFNDMRRALLEGNHPTKEQMQRALWPDEPPQQESK